MRARPNRDWFRRVTARAVAALLAACASSPPQLPYPAFLQIDELPDVFVAGMPGIRAKQWSGNPQSRTSSNRLALPPQWQFSTGASPGKTIELFVLAGTLTLGEFRLEAGGYAYLPQGTTGVSISTQMGAEVLYFIEDADPAAVIETPLLINSGVLKWESVSDDPNDFGIWHKTLRHDPGSGATSWLVRIDTIASQGWRRSMAVEEGYLVAGVYRHSECYGGEVATGQYTRGGYFKRPAGVVNGGPESLATETAVWFLRSARQGLVEPVDACTTSVASP